LGEIRSITSDGTIVFHLSGVTSDMRTRTRRDIGEIIRQRRNDLGLTQTDLAEQADTTRQWVSRIEKGHADYTVDRLLAVFAALDLTIDVQSVTINRARGSSMPTETVGRLNDHIRSLMPTERIAALNTPIAESALFTSIGQHIVEESGLSDTLRRVAEQMAEDSGIGDVARQAARFRLPGMDAEQK